MKHLKLTAFAGLVILCITGCNKPGLTGHESFLEVTGGKIWYRVTGEGTKTPLLMLHGGPGYPSYYFNPLMEIGQERPLITFDQLGCGRSDRITDTTLMTIDAYIEQTERLLSHLGIKEFYLYGHSWGSMLGTDYYVKHGDNVKGLILASPCLSSQRWVADADTLIAALPDSVSMVLRNEIKGLKQDSVTLSSAVASYFHNFYTRVQPTSADIDSANAQMGTNVYQYMWGSNEFFVTGTLKNYDRTGDLGRIKVPTLYITGEFDAARPTTVKHYQSLTPHAKLVVIKNAGHMTMHDNPVDDMKAISNFLNEVDSQ